MLPLLTEAKYFGFSWQYMDNPYAIYVNCDGAMDYTSGNPGGVGFNITFPESVGLAPIPMSLLSGHTFVEGRLK